MTTVAVILGLIVLLILGLILVFVTLNKRASKSASLTAFIDIYPSGKSTVEFVPYKNIAEDKLLKIALLYAAKIRYVLEGENPQVVEAYKSFVGEIVTPPHLDYLNRTFVEKLSDFVEQLQVQDESPAATEDGERFTIRLIEGKSTNFVNNDLPLSGLSVNIPISVILLAHSVAIRLSEQNVKIFERAYLTLGSVMFAPNTQPELFNLNQAALDAIEFARTIDATLSNQH